MKVADKPEIRLAIVQHGDDHSAYAIFRNDLPEPYAGMKRSVGAIEDLIDGRKFLLISLDGPARCSEHHRGQLSCLPSTSDVRWLPRRLTAAWQRFQVMAQVRAFSPTHLLIRTGGKLAVNLLTYAARHDVRCMVVFANVFDPRDRNAEANRQLVHLLNQSFVHRVANHLQPAVDSMIDCGVHPDRAIAYDFDLKRPSSCLPPKHLKPGTSCHLVFAGALVRSKGAEDTVLAAVELRRRGLPVRLSVYGDGPERGRLERVAARIPVGLITFHGRQPNHTVGQAMQDSTFVCVTSHREFPEGMPMTLTEALATRSPVIATTHPVFMRAFLDGEGVRFVREKDPQQIADAIEQTWKDPAEYQRLSQSTTLALNRVRCETGLSSLLQEWAQTF